MPSKQTANRTVHLSDGQGILRQSTPILGIPTVESVITWHCNCRISHYLAFRLWNRPLLGIPTVESAVRAPDERGRIIHLKSTYFVYLLERFDASHEVAGVMAHVVSTDIPFEGAFLNQDTRLMVDQSKIWIARPASDRALVLEYEDMLTGNSSKLSRSQCL